MFICGKLLMLLFWSLNFKRAERASDNQLFWIWIKVSFPWWIQLLQLQVPPPPAPELSISKFKFEFQISFPPWRIELLIVYHRNSICRQIYLLLAWEIPTRNLFSFPRGGGYFSSPSLLGTTYTRIIICCTQMWIDSDKTNLCWFQYSVLWILMKYNKNC